MGLTSSQSDTTARRAVGLLPLTLRVKGSPRGRVPACAARWAIRHSGAAALLISLAGLALAMASDPAAKTTQHAAIKVSASPQPAANPHGTAEGCAACHDQHGGQWVVPPLGEVDALCLTCHDGSSAPREAHPIGRRFAGPHVVQPPDWPAPQGVLACLTCHDMVRGCIAGGLPPEQNRLHLRGNAPPQSSAYCAQCHVEALHERFNPHTILAKAAPAVDASCRFCHDPTPDIPADGLRRGAPALIAAEPALCLRCHDYHVDYFEPGHTGAPISDKILAQLRGHRPTDGNGETVRTRLALPLTAEGRVTCSTCHNPHGKELFAEGTELSAGAMGPPRDGRYALRVPGLQLCQACHGP